MDSDDGAGLSVRGSAILHYIADAPHPAAAKLLINWLLTKEGGVSYSKNLQDNSRRVDVSRMIAPPCRQRARTTSCWISRT